MAKKEDEQYLDFLRYQEVPRETISKKDEKWLGSKQAQRDYRKHDKKLTKLEKWLDKHGK